jgi:hypothetical protein
LIVRVFRARVHPGKDHEFRSFLAEVGVPMVTAAEGCTHVTVGESRWSDRPEFVVRGPHPLATLSLWGATPGD